MEKIFLLLFILFSFSLELQSEESHNQYAQIKKLIETKQLYKAKLELNLALKGNENDPTLNLYQTELWILEGEVFFNQGQYKKAIETYEKAIQNYPSNPLVKAKYTEMLRKVNDAKSSSNTTIPFTPLALQGGLEEKLSVDQTSMTYLEKIGIAIILQNIFILSFLLFILLKRRL